MEIATLLEYSDRSQLRAWLPDGRLAQRLSPRRKNSHWTKLNMDRCIDLEDRGLMTPAGRWAFEHAYGYGYQVFHPTPEQRKQMIEEAKARRLTTT